LDAALELVVEVGYDRLSMDALAERARASKATIYRHWSGKAEVVAEAVRCRQCHQLSSPDTGSLRGDLLVMLDEIGTSLAAEDGAVVAGVLWAARSDPVLAGLMRAQAAEGKQAIARRIVDQAVARGEIPPGADPQTITEVVPAMVFMRLLITGEPIDAAFFEHVVDDIVVPVLES
jgi:AcrR family transcriptional regulator